MNSQGYTKDNIHKGNTKIVAGGIDVDGLIRVGDQSVGGDGYVLPSVKGTEGQVLTMNADNTTSFQDASGGGTETRIGSGNNDNVSAVGGTLNQGFLPSFSGVRLTDIKNIPPGSSYVLEAQSEVEFSYDGSSPSVITNLKTNLNLILGGTSSNTATITNTANNNVYPSPVVVGTTYRSNWFYKAIVTRSVLGNGFFINAFSTMNRFGNTNYLVNMATSPTGGIFLTIDGDPNDTTLDFTFQFDQALGSGTLVQYTTPDIHWYISQLGEVDAPTLTTNDHTQLTNLNAGDSGHTQFALLQGRSGGQVLSGGITPANFLTLKSHTAGLNNIVVKDLNTSFEKDIDMNTNDITNANQINRASNGNIINLDNDVIPPLINGALTIEAGSGKQLWMSAPSDVRLTSSGAGTLFDCGAGIHRFDDFSGTNMTISGVQITMDKQLSMSNNPIINSGNVSGLAGTVRLDNAPQMEILANGTLCICTFNGSTIHDTRSLGATTQVFKINNNDRVVMGISNILFKNVPVDFDNQAITSVGSINNYSVIGGLSTGTSNSAVLTTSTAEQSILPLTFIGSRTVPANAFNQGDSYSARLAGSFGSNNGDTLTIRLKGGATATTILSSVVVPLNNSSGSSFELDIMFSIRQVGSAGVAELVSNYAFTYNQSGGGGAFVGERNCEINTTTFATDVVNQLEITAQFSSASASNSIQTFISNLHKIF